MMDWIAYVVVAMFIDAAAVLLVKHLMTRRINPHSVLLFFLSMTGIFLLLLSEARGSIFIPDALSIGLIALAGVLGAVGYNLLYSAINQAPNPAYPVSVNDVNVLLITIFSAMLLGSDFSSQRFLGIILVVSGVVIIGLSENHKKRK
jgi:drug/metabolite transporter (DMT)-like permease